METEFGIRVRVFSKTYGRRIVWGLLYLFILYESLHTGFLLKENSKSLGIRFSEACAETETFDMLLKTENKEEEKVKGCLWEKTKDSISGELKNTAQKVTIYSIYGDMDVGYWFDNMTGVIPAESDKMGCMIDSNTALSLYGTQKVLGNVIMFQNEKYYIRGVLKTKENVLLRYESKSFLEEQGEQKNGFSNMELSIDGKAPSKEEGKQLLMQYSFDEDFFVTGGSDMGVILVLLAKISLWLVMILLSMQFAKENKQQFQGIKRYCFLLFNLFVLFTAIKLSGFPTAIPEDMIPVKWSDMSFYQNLISGKKEYVQNYFYYVRSYRDCQQLFLFIKGLLLCAIDYALVYVWKR